MTFNEAEKYLLSLGNEVETMKLGLENIGRLLTALGNPEKGYLKVQVAGTNGKGSVCAFLDSICIEAGVRTGRYTSPHLVSITERIKLDGRDISEAEFAENASAVRATAESLVSKGLLERVPTFFEQVTATALRVFAERRIEVAILETGLGGRYDATTAAVAEIAVLTRIDLDHQEYLGGTIEKIAAEKAAIIRAGSRVVVGAQDPAALSVILDRCREFAITPADAGNPYNYLMDAGPRITAAPEFGTSPRGLGVELGLRGRHQVENANTAVKTAAVLANDFGIQISEDQIQQGLKRAEHPGRLEFSDGILFDGAHNAGGAAALAAYLDESDHRPITMIFGTMRDKDVPKMAETLWPRADQLILTQPANSRAMSVEELAGLAPGTVDRARISLLPSVPEALAEARRHGDRDGIVVITGSLYLIGEVKKLLAGSER